MKTAQPNFIGRATACAALLALAVGAVVAGNVLIGQKAKEVSVKIEADGDWAEVEDANGGLKLKRPSPDNKKKFKATVTPADGNKDKYRIRFRLVGVSKQPGTNNNTGDSKEFDLVFKKQEGFDDPTEDGQTIIQTAAEGNVATVEVTSTDYGPIGTIVAEVEYKKGLFEKSTALPVIADADTNDIEDAWDAKFPAEGAGKKASSDLDDKPELNKDKGDGFSRYEEYRGFTIQDKFSTTDPKTKDWFYLDVDNIDQLRFMTDAVYDGMHLHKLKLTEADKKYVVNFNRGANSAGEQKATPITNSKETDGSWGLAEGLKPFTPNSTTYCRVFVAKHKRTVTSSEKITKDQKYVPMTPNADDPQIAWRENGTIMLDDEQIKYRDIQYGSVKTTLFAPANKTTTVLLIEPPDDAFLRERYTVLIGEAGTEFALSTYGFNAKRVGTSKLTKKIGKADTVLDVADAEPFDFSTLDDAYVVIDEEQMKLDKVDFDKKQLTVKRAQNGTAAAEHAVDAVASLPNSLVKVKRAQYGSAALAFKKGDKAEQPQAFIDCTRGANKTTAAEHDANKGIGYFFSEEETNKSIAHTVTHEAAHTLSAKHLREPGDCKPVPEEFRFFLNPGQCPGSVEGNGIASSHSPKNLKEMRLK